MGGIPVEIRLGVRSGAMRPLDRALAQFEDFRTLTQSVRAAIPVGVRVLDRDGVVLAVRSAGLFRISSSAV